jgi:SAM-dependent methyltransferase
VNPLSVPRCAWCGAAAQPSGGRLAECDACGTATTWPAPGDEELQAAYAGFYRPTSGRFSGGGDRILRYSRGLLAGRLNRIAPSGPILDVGSGDGALLEAVIARGRTAVGLEQGEQAPRSHLDVRAIEIVDFDDRRGDWAAVVFWHALEHLQDPRGAIRQASRLLAPSGVLVIAVPNRDSWQARALKDRWLALDLPRHLVHLPARALVQGVRDCGMTVERLSYWRGGQVMFGWLDGLVSTLPSHPSLYDAIRQSDARAAAMDPGRRMTTLLSGMVLAPAAAALAAAEIAARSGGSVYLEARKPDRAGSQLTGRKGWDRSWPPRRTDRRT